MKTTKQEIIVGLDLGSTAIRVAIGKRCDERIEIIGVGQSPSQGIRKGRVINIESTASDIRKAVNQAQLMARCKVRDVVVGIADGTILSHNSHGEVRIQHGKVSEKDIRGVFQSAMKPSLPPDHNILYNRPCEFIIDKQARATQPFGMNGSVLEVTTHLITVASASIKNVVDACKLAGLKGLDIVLQSLATAETLLLPEEREQGVVLIDIGSGIVKTTVFSNNVMWLQGVTLAYGGHLTMDLAVGLRIPMEQAEQIKRIHGCCLESTAISDDMVEIDSLKDNCKQLIQRQHIVNIIGPRMEEMFMLIAKQFQQSGHNVESVAGAVITGGNSQLMGIVELAKQVLKMPVRIGKPEIIKGVLGTISLPHHSTAVGLVLLGARIDGVQQGITVKGGNSLVLHATQLIRRVTRK